MDQRLEPYNYELPPERIAVYPLKDRTASKLLVLDTETVCDSSVSELSQCLQSGDVLVVNNTKVLQARTKAFRQTGAKLEMLFLSEQEDAQGCLPVLIKPSRKIKEGETIFLPVEEKKIPVEVVQYQGEGEWTVRIQEPIPEILEKIGRVPIPPYLQRDTELDDQTRYQTVFAGPKGAVAAPTAGLHLTEDLFAQLREKGVQIAEITLHVGIGTFRNLRPEDLERGTLHKEYFELPEKTAQIIQTAKKNGGKIFAVGTTVTRCLESVFIQEGDIVAKTGYTDIFIQEGFSFSVIDGLFTNFHLPKSSLLMLVCAFGGRERILQAYQYAIDEQYRFFSYGDAMLILNKSS